MPSPSQHEIKRDPKRGMIWSVFLLLCSPYPNLNKDIWLIQAECISNDIHEGDALLAFQLSKGSTTPISTESSCTPLVQELVNARNSLPAMLKPNHTLVSKVTREPTGKAGDMMQIFICSGKWKANIISFLLVHSSLLTFKPKLLRMSAERDASLLLSLDMCTMWFLMTNFPP